MACEPAITLTRLKTGDGSKPEFLSAVVLPGRGMNLFQITAYVPDKGEIPLLHSPSLEEAAGILGGPDDPYGTKAFTFGGAFLVPFANRIIGPLHSAALTLDVPVPTWIWEALREARELLVGRLRRDNAGRPLPEFFQSHGEAAGVKWVELAEPGPRLIEEHVIAEMADAREDHFRAVDRAVIGALLDDRDPEGSLLLPRLGIRHMEDSAGSSPGSPLRPTPHCRSARSTRSSCGPFPDRSGMPPLISSAP